MREETWRRGSRACAALAVHGLAGAAAARRLSSPRHPPVACVSAQQRRLGRRVGRFGVEVSPRPHTKPAYIQNRKSELYAARYAAQNHFVCEL